MEQIKKIIQGSLQIKLIAILIVLLLPAAYYFGYFLPRQKEEARVFSMQQKCREVGEKLYKEDVASNDPLESIIWGAEYYYNKSLNTCFYYNRISSLFSVQHSSVESFVRDSFTNKVLLLWHWERFDEDIEVKDCDICVPTEEEFTAKKEILFSR